MEPPNRQLPLPRRRGRRLLPRRRGPGPSQQRKEVAGFAGFTSFAAIVFGLIFLLLDLGRPAAVFNAFNQPFTSVMAFTWIITFFAIVSLAYTSFFIGAFPWSKPVAGRKALAVLGMILALITMYYTGLLLGVNLSRPFWNQSLIPILFTVSGASTGIALVEVAPKVMSSRNHPELEEETKGLAGADVLLMGLETYIVISILYILYNSTAAGTQAVDTWISGSLSLYFWAGFVTVGLAVPFLLYAGVLTTWKARPVASAIATALAGLLVLVGGLILRYIVLGAGTTVNFLASVGIATQVAPSFGPTTAQLEYTVALFVVMAVVYAVGSYTLLRSRAGPQATTATRAT